MSAPGRGPVAQLAAWACLAAFAGLPSVAMADGIVFLGNSITRHGPDSSIGWPGDWGMAASRAELDYVSRTTAILRGWTGVTLKATVLSDYELERHFFDMPPVPFERMMDEVPHARFAVLQFGDNLDLSGERADGVQFGERYAMLLTALRSRLDPNARLICVGRWWPAPMVDGQIERLCAVAHGKFVRIADLHQELWGAAGSERRYQLPGVGDHPGDRAMNEIALRVAAGAR